MPPIEFFGLATGADASCWHAGTGPEGPRSAGDPYLSGTWTRDFVDHVLADGGPGNGQLLRHFLDPAAKPSVPWPCSAALVRVSKAHGSWLAALSFHPRRLFQPSDVKALLLARRLLLNQRRHAQEVGRLRESLMSALRCLTVQLDGAKSAENPAAQAVDAIPAPQDEPPLLILP